jgi:hypothetical protein
MIEINIHYFPIPLNSSIPNNKKPKFQAFFRPAHSIWPNSPIQSLLSGPLAAYLLLLMTLHLKKISVSSSSPGSPSHPSERRRGRRSSRPQVAVASHLHARRRSRPRARPRPPLLLSAVRIGKKVHGKLDMNSTFYTYFFNFFPIYKRCHWDILFMQTSNRVLAKLYKSRSSSSRPRILISPSKKVLMLLFLLVIKI